MDPFGVRLWEIYLNRHREASGWSGYLCFFAFLNKISFELGDLAWFSMRRGAFWHRRPRTLRSCVWEEIGDNLWCLLWQYPGSSWLSNCKQKDTSSITYPPPIDGTILMILMAVRTMTSQRRLQDFEIWRSIRSILLVPATGHGEKTQERSKFLVPTGCLLNNAVNAANEPLRRPL